MEWDEGIDLAERCEERWGEDLKIQIDVLQQLFESHAQAMAGVMTQVVGAVTSGR